MLVALAFGARVLLDGAIVHWTFDLERKACRCSRSWKRGYLRASHAADMALRLLVLALPVKPFALLLAVVAFDVAQFAVLLSYAAEMDTLECECSAGWRRALAFAWPVVYFSLFATMASFALLYYTTVPRRR